MAPAAAATTFPVQVALSVSHLLCVPGAQVRLFVFLGAVAAGTFLGGPVGDRVGFKAVVWGSILGVLSFTLALPYVELFWTTVMTIPIGLTLASAIGSGFSCCTEAECRYD